MGICAAGLCGNGLFVEWRAWSPQKAWLLCELLTRREATTVRLSLFY